MISKETIAKIQDEADIVDVLSDFITLKRSGSNYKAPCPFHNEKTPSFMVSPAKGIYKCFGCGVSGNTVKFVMEHEKMPFVEALRYLADKYSIEIEEIEESPEAKSRQAALDSLFIINEYAAKVFHHHLLHTEEGKNVGLSYLKERGFSEKTIQKFQLGYTLRNATSFTDAALKDGYKLDLLKKAGVTSPSENSQHDFFRERIMFPIHSVSGKVLGFGGRTLRSDKKIPKYINTSDTDIYDKSRILYGMYFAKNSIRKLDECILVEGYTDVISLYQAGVEQVVASSGTSLTEEQVRLIKRYTSNITLLFDGDEAGIKAALRGVDIILEGGLNVRICALPNSHDPDSFIKEKGLSGFEAYKKEKSTDFVLFKMQVLLLEAGKDPVKKAAVIQDIVESIRRIEDPIKRSVYVSECAEKLGISEEILLTEINKRRKKSIQNKRRQSHTSQEKETEDVSIDDEATIQQEKRSISFYEQDVIRVLIEHGHRPFDTEKLAVEYILSELEGIVFETPLFQKIINIAQNRRQHKEYGKPTFFTHHSDNEIASLAIKLTAFPHEISENWYKKYKISIPEVEFTFKKDIASAINRLKWAKVLQMEQESLRRLQNENQTEEEWEKNNRLHKKVLELKKELSSIVKTVITMQ